LHVEKLKDSTIANSFPNLMYEEKVMTGRAFIRLIAKRGIPLSCIANKLDCKLSTLKAIEKMETVPRYYSLKFINAFKDSLTLSDMELLTQ